MSPYVIAILKIVGTSIIIALAIIAIGWVVLGQPFVSIEQQEQRLENNHLDFRRVMKLTEHEACNLYRDRRLRCTVRTSDGFAQYVCDINGCDWVKTQETK